MAQLNITLNQDEVLQMLGDDTGNAFRVLLQETLNGVLQAESAEQLRAGRYERTELRTDSRNGTRRRPLTTRIGTIELEVPRHRDVPFRSLVFDNYSRSEGALVTTMAEMVVAGVSTARVGRVMEALCGKSFSKQAVSECCTCFDGAVADFLARPLDDDYLFLMVDATYLKAREEHRVVSKALMIAVAFTRRGGREVVGFGIYDRECEESWTDFLTTLRRRGMGDLRMITSDAHEGIRAAVPKVFPGVPLQRCQAHFARNVADKAPDGYRIGLRSELVEMFNCENIASARRRRDEILADYARVAPKAMECLDEGFDDAMTVMDLPTSMRRWVRTTNCIERLNAEVKRRSKVIGVFPNGGSIMRLMGMRLIEENDRWMTQKQKYYAPAVKELEECRERLAQIAMRQQALLEAA